MTQQRKPRVVVIGGGPGGSTAAAFLAREGVEVQLFESAIHPRPHVGESMVTSTTLIFDKLGFLPVMERERFPRKYGASWHPITTSAEVSIEFAEYKQPGINQDYTYHVDRSRLDALLLRHASELGAKVHQGVEVKDVLMRDGRAGGVRIEVVGQSLEVEADYVVDASGRRAVLGRKLGLLVKDPHFDQYATHAWFENVDRSQCGTPDFIHIYFLPVERGWVWQIPINDRVTSIGVVVEKREFRKAKGAVEEWFHQMIQSTPDVQRALAQAVRINDFKQEGDYSYSMSRFGGPGYRLVGDAARFVDPIFSSGVSVALTSGMFAAESILEMIHGGVDEQTGAEQYDHKLRAGVNIWYEFITSYYRLLPLFTLFIKKKEYRLQVLRLLQGDVYDRTSVPVLDAMKEFISVVESNKNHLFHKYLGNIDPAEADSLEDAIAMAHAASQTG